MTYDLCVLDYRILDGPEWCPISIKHRWFWNMQLTLKPEVICELEKKEKRNVRGFHFIRLVKLLYFHWNQDTNFTFQSKNEIHHENEKKEKNPKHSKLSFFGMNWMINVLVGCQSFIPVGIPILYLFQTENFTSNCACVCVRVRNLSVYDNKKRNMLIK